MPYWARISCAVRLQRSLNGRIVPQPKIMLVPWHPIQESVILGPPPGCILPAKHGRPEHDEDNS